MTICPKIGSWFDAPSSRYPTPEKNCALDIDRRAALRVLGVVLRPSHRLGSRNQQLKAGKVAPQVSADRKWFFG